MGGNLGSTTNGSTPSVTPNPTPIATSNPTPIATTPARIPKYKTGDLVTWSKSTEGSATVILGYDSSYDQYKTDIIFTNLYDDNRWHFLEDSQADWRSASLIESAYPYVVGNINIYQITYGDPTYSSSHSGGYSSLYKSKYYSSSDPPVYPEVTPKSTVTPSTVPSSTVTIEVDYSGTWDGTYGDLGMMQYEAGSGYRTITLTDPDYTVPAMFQKSDASTKTMTIKIKRGGTILKQGSTSKPNGVVSIVAII